MIFFYFILEMFFTEPPPESGERFQMMFQLNPAYKWAVNKKIFEKQNFLEPKFPFFSYFFDQKKEYFLISNMFKSKRIKKF